MMDIPPKDRAAIEFCNVSYGLNGGSEVLRGLNLEIRRGETLVLLGRSGSGKTTTLKLINRLLTATEGEIRVDGRPLGEWDVIRLRRMIGYVIQEAGLFPHYTVERNIGLVPKMDGWPAGRIRERVQELLQLVGLEPEMALRYPRELSGGQRQRVGVARALAVDPPFLLMDEPFGALDPLTRAELQREFLALQERLRKTVVFVTHDLREALLLGSRVALLEAGRLVAVYTKPEFMASDVPLVVAYKHAFAADLGRAFMNLWQFVVQNHVEVVELTLEHLWLVALSTGLAVLVGIPLGILITRRPWLNKPVLGSANIIQTIPSLALFGFLLPAPWIGARADRLAILALMLYALLPLIRNTYAGIKGVDPAVVEAGRGMGLTDRQLLFQVELPLALGVIIAGVRVATVISVGLATIAAAIGAGGLGEYIFRGLAMVNNTVILAGAIPAALMALAADVGLGWLEKKLSPH